jgi:glucose/arabinose dehydrogenase
MRPITLALVVLAGAWLPVATAQAVTGPIVVVSGLDNPRGMNFGPDGSLFIAEAGRGGPRCVARSCSGATGAIAKLTNGRLTRFFKGLVSVGGRDGVGVTGPHDVGVATVSGRVYTVIGGGEAPRGTAARLRQQLGKMLRVNALAPGSIEVLAGLTEIELAQNPDKRAKQSNPSGVAIIGNDRFVADAAGNDLLIEHDGNVSVGAVFPRAAPGADSVPTAVRVGPDGALYVGEFTGDRAPNGQAKVWRVVPGQPPEIFARGFTRITGLAFGPDGSLYVSEFGRSLRSQKATGDVVRQFPDGRREVIGKDKLTFPGGVAVRSDGVVFVSNYSILPGRPAKSGPFRGRTGQIVRFNP